MQGKGDDSWVIAEAVEARQANNLNNSRPDDVVGQLRAEVTAAVEAVKSSPTMDGFSEIPQLEGGGFYCRKPAAQFR